MFVDLQRYPWVLPIYRYLDLPGLLSAISTGIIAPAERKAAELRAHGTEN